MKHQFYLMLFFFLMNSCGFDNKLSINANNSIGGKVLPLSGVVHYDHNSLFNSAYAFPTCEDDVFARLYKVNLNGKLEASPVMSTIVANASFKFKGSLPLDVKDPLVNYQVVIEGCNEIFTRPVTGVNSQQDVTYASSIIGLTTQVNLNKSLSQATKVEVEKLLKELSGGSLNLAFSSLTDNTELSNLFQNIFNDSPAKLLESHPSVSLLSFPSMQNEGLASTFQVGASHFNSGYAIAYEWLLDGNEQSLTNQWVHNPSANSSGNYSVTIVVGRDDLTGHVDRTKPYFTVTKDLTILNTLPAVPPSFTLGSAFSNDGNVDVKVSTGVGLGNCESFSSFLITESTLKPSSSDPGFTRTCSTFLEQTEPYVIATGVGVKTLSLWVKDANGVVSDFPSIQSLTYDTNSPLVSLTSPSGTFRGGESVSLTFSATENETSLATFKLQFASDGVTFADTATLTSGSTSYSWTVPMADTLSAKIRIVAIDQAGNSTTVDSTAFGVDSSPPDAPGVTLTSLALTSSTFATMTIGSCTDRAGIKVTESATAPLPGDSGWQTCTTTASGINHTLSSSDGTKNLYVWAKDSVGNVSNSSTLGVVLDQTPPVVNILTPAASSVIKGGTTYNVTWTATDANLSGNSITIELSSDSGGSWASLTTTTNSGSYSWSVAAANANVYRIRIKALDGAGNLAIATHASNFAIDSLPPDVTALSITQGASTGINTIQVNLSGNDALSNVTHFCLRYNSTTTPTSSHPCWKAVNSPAPGISPAPSITFSNYYYLIGFTPGNYSVYGWLKDAAGNISSLSNAGAGTTATDLATINYQPGTPPVVINVLATGNDAPSSPPTSTDLSAPTGSDVFIKWTATDDLTLPSNPVSLYYTTDDVNYTLITSGLPNSAGVGCTISGALTGCYRWSGGSPTSEYFNVRVAVQDSNSMITFGSSTALNTMPPIRFLAGNTEDGTGASASSAMFFNDYSTSSNPDTGSLLVATNGTIYFRDVKRGILIINPQDGIQKILIPTTGVSTGDGGPVSNATLNIPFKIALDYQERILVYDNDRIRRINTNSNPVTIETIIGGGLSSTDNVSPLDVLIVPPNITYGGSARQMPFFALPNGDIYFLSNNYADAPVAGFKIRLYDASLDLVTSIVPSGIGHHTDASQDISECRIVNFGMIFDPVTSSPLRLLGSVNRNTSLTPNCPGSNSYRPVNLDPITGESNEPHPVLGSQVEHPVQARNGDLYFINRNIGDLKKFDPTTNVWTTVAGSGTSGSCVDNTPALSCDMDILDAFVSDQGQIYLMDRGRLRTIDASGNVITLFGQSTSFGDGGNPLSARFSVINSIAQLDDGKVIVLDQIEKRFREFLSGGTITTIAGNGRNQAPTVGIAALGQPIQTQVSGSNWDDFKADSVTGDIYYSRGNVTIGKLTRSSGQWSSVVGSGGTNYWSADGLSGGNIKFGTYPARIVGISPQDILVIFHTFSSPNHSHTMMKTFRYSDSSYVQVPLLGVQGTSPSDFCIDGVPGTSCGVPHSYQTYNTDATYDSTGSRWILMKNGTSDVRTITPGGSLETLLTLTNSARSFVYRRTGSTPAEVVYYCDTTGRLRKNDFTSDIPLAWPITSIECTGRSLIYNSANNSLIFPYVKNGMYGVAEYLNP